MIIIQVYFPKVNTLSSCLEAFTGIIQAYNEAVNAWTGACPCCGKKFIKHGTYERQTPSEYGPFSIQRVWCGTGGCSSHALIPHFIIPYSRRPIETIEAAIRAIVLGKQKLEQIAEDLNVDTTTVKRWWKLFRTRADLIIATLAKRLASTSQTADWLGGFSSDIREKVKKIFQLLERYRDAFFPDSCLPDLSFINLMNSSLLSARPF